jgi:hypothetical protein
MVSSAALRLKRSFSPFFLASERAAAIAAVSIFAMGYPPHVRI